MHAMLEDLDRFKDRILAKKREDHADGLLAKVIEDHWASFFVDAILE
jgi:hypothetical protein